MAVTGPGRPARYCSTGCRRAAEHEVRRANGHLARLESERDALLAERAAMEAGVHLLTTEHARRGVEVEIEANAECRAAYEARLRALLSDEAA